MSTDESTLVPVQPSPGTPPEPPAPPPPAGAPFARAGEDSGALPLRPERLALADGPGDDDDDDDDDDDSGGSGGNIDPDDDEGYDDDDEDDDEEPLRVGPTPSLSAGRASAAA